MGKIQLQISKKYNIDCVCVGDILSTKNVVLHLNSANTDNLIINYFHVPNNRNYCFICPNLPGNSFESKYHSLRRNSSYLKIISQIIDKLKENYPNIKNIYLTGES